MSFFHLHDSLHLHIQFSTRRDENQETRAKRDRLIGYDYSWLELSREMSCHVEDEFPLNQIMQCLCGVSFPVHRSLTGPSPRRAAVLQGRSSLPCRCPVCCRVCYTSEVQAEALPGNLDRITSVLVDRHHGPMGFHAHESSLIRLLIFSCHQ